MLLSGHGRHRRPRPAPRFMVAAGVAGAGMALPLLGASAANAASSDTWDAVAQCESDDNWSVNSGNGYYGGLQLSQQTWEDYGGLEFAERPDLASQEDQIEVAERVLSEQGPEVWPSCSLAAGLEQDDAEPDATWDPGEGTGYGERDGGGTEGAQESQDGPDYQDGSDYQDAQDQDAQDQDGWDAQGSWDQNDRDAQDGDIGGDAGEPDSRESADPGSDQGGDTSEDGDTSSRQDDGGGDAIGDGGAGGGSPESGAPVLPGEGSEFPVEPEISQQLTGVDGSGAEVEGGSEGDGGTGGSASGGRVSRGSDEKRGDGGTYTVAPGDTLYTIAESQDVPGGWDGLYEANRDLIGGDPDVIRPGQQLNVR